MQLSITRALISVTDKTGLETLARALHQKRVELIASGGTAQFIRSIGIPVTDASKITGNPEAFGGRMKTISFQLGSALLYRRGHERDEAEAQKLSIPKIDLVVCNLYPFQEGAKRASITEAELTELVDIGGPLMIRAAAKNFTGISVLVDPMDYDSWIQEFKENQGQVSLETRKKGAYRAWKMIAEYDQAILSEFENRWDLTKPDSTKRTLRYGENAHQEAEFSPMTDTSVQVQVLQEGKELSYNNFLDADAAWRIMRDCSTVFPGSHAVTVIKHGNPCGLALSLDPLTLGSENRVLETAWAGDPISAFGGIIGFNHKVTETHARFFLDRFIEVIVAPDFTSEALAFLSQKKNLRVIQYTDLNLKSKTEKMIRSCLNGQLIQSEDLSFCEPNDWKEVTVLRFSDAQKKCAQLGVIAAKHLKSNAIALVTEILSSEAATGGLYSLVGAGMGQPNRLDCIQRLAVPRAQEKGFQMKNLILVSDAFFPFPDSVEVAHQAGIRWLVQPGGSVKDNDVISACDRLQLGMIFTGERHFRH